MYYYENFARMTYHIPRLDTRLGFLFHFHSSSKCCLITGARRLVLKGLAKSLTVRLFDLNTT